MVNKVKMQKVISGVCERLERIMVLGLGKPIGGSFHAAAMQKIIPEAQAELEAVLNEPSDGESNRIKYIVGYHPSRNGDYYEHEMSFSAPVSIGDKVLEKELDIECPVFSVVHENNKPSVIHCKLSGSAIHG